FIIISLIFLTSIYIINQYDFYADRFLSLYLSCLLILLEFSNIIIGYLAKYLRAHKSEPFYAISVLMGILYFGIISLLNFKYFKIDIIIILLNIVSWFVIVPLAIFIFKKFKLNYYEDTSYE
ncbi:hypothetical protein, partial [Sulfurovum riftiae]|uniref:hypothetical protein n=1 Tax=Sulfurovum riftiae TaxID=1630136 RepID=UPI000AB4224C